MASAASVLRTIKKAGSPVVLRSVPVSADYDPVTGAMSSSSVDSTRYAVLLDMLTGRPQLGFGSLNLLNTDIDGVRKWALMDAVGHLPKVQDKVVNGETLYEVINVQSVSVKNLDVMYVLALKK